MSVDNAKCGWRPVTGGVPRGSILEPVLFLIFVNDLFNNVDSSIKLFADDIQIYRRADTEEETAATERLVGPHHWSEEWQLPFNKEKCKVMHYGHGNYWESYCLDTQQPNIRLNATEEEKDLGITFDSKLKFSKHVNAVTSKARALEGIIKRCFRNLESKGLLMLCL